MSSYADRLTALREQLKADKLDGFVVPLTDEHMSEYVGSYAQRLAWLTGFQGSAGSAVVLPEEAAIFTDGRYTLQVREQVDGRHWDYVSVPATSIAMWLGAHAAAGARVGYDPWLHTRGWVEEARKALAEREADAVVLSALDSIAWTLNVRGQDVAHTPVALAYAIVDADGTADLFVAPEKIGDDVLQHLGNAVRVRDRAAFPAALG